MLELSCLSYRVHAAERVRHASQEICPSAGEREEVEAFVEPACA